LQQPTKLVTTNHTYTLDLLYTLGTLFSLKWFLLQIPAMWTFAGPIALLSALAVATWRLKRNNESWCSLGLFNTGNYLTLILWTIGAFIIALFIGNVGGALANALISSPGEVNDQINVVVQNRFSNVQDNIPVYIYWLVISWVIGGFTEELLFRGFMILRFEKALSKLPFATAIAIFLQALIFGQQHMYYQGYVGLVETGFIAISSGLIFVLCKRRLWPLIISHGLANTIGMTMIFMGNT
jgi:membrane protease YdiL (CAAX protease family)